LIDTVILVSSPVEAPGRCPLGVENILKDVGIIIATDPAQGKQLEIPAHNVTIESAKLVRTQFKPDSNLFQLLLNNRGVLAARFLG
jgi:hypothetical protein